MFEFIKIFTFDEENEQRCKVSTGYRKERKFYR